MCVFAYTIHIHRMILRINTFITLEKKCITYIVALIKHFIMQIFGNQVRRSQSDKPTTVCISYP